MKLQLLLTVAGLDRPGIVTRLAEVLADHDADWEESRMAILGGECAAIVLALVPDKQVEVLRQALADLSNEGIKVAVKVAEKSGANKRAEYDSYRLSLSGAEHEGPVFRITQYLQEHAIGIQNMETPSVPAPISATPLIRMSATVLVPVTMPYQDLDKDLRNICFEEGVDFVMSSLSAL